MTVTAVDRAFAVRLRCDRGLSDTFIGDTATKVAVVAYARLFETILTVNRMSVMVMWITTL